MKTTFILIRPYSVPTTGAHYRFDRVVSRLQNLNSSIFLIGISGVSDRPACASAKNGIFVPYRERLVGISLFIAILRHFYLLWRLRKSESLVLGFGETSYLAMLIASLLSRSPMHVGVRSNYIQRMRIQIDNNTGLSRICSIIYLIPAYLICYVCYAFSAMIVVQTPEAKQNLMSQFFLPDKRISVLQNDIPWDRIGKSKKTHYSISPKLILLVGNNLYIKGFDIMLESIRICNARDHFFDSVIFCGLSLPSYFIHKYPDEISNNNIRFIPYCKSLPRLMADQDLLVVPSREDQFPNAILEAIGVGLPVIGAYVDGIPHIINDDILLFSPNSPDSLAKMLLQIRNPFMYNQAKAFVDSRVRDLSFDWEYAYLSKLISISN